MGDVKLGIMLEGFIELQEKLKSLDRNIQRKIHEAMKVEAGFMENIAKANCPVRTGKLRDSIYSKVKDLGVEIGATVSYAAYQEFGTKYIKPKGFLKDAVWQRKQYLLNRINRALGESIQEESR